MGAVVNLNSLRDQAVRCRRQAREIADRQAVEMLNQMADECDALLTSLESDRAPAGVGKWQSACRSGGEGKRRVYRVSGAILADDGAEGCNDGAG